MPGYHVHNAPAVAGVLSIQVVEVKAPDPVPERYWKPELPASNGSPGSSGSSGGTARGTSALDTWSRQQAPRRGAQQQQRQQRSPSPPPQRQRQKQQQQWQQQPQQQGQAAAGRAWGTAAPSAPTVWSDDAALLMLDYRPPPTASAASSPASGQSAAALSSNSSSGSGFRRAAAAATAALAAAPPPPAPPLEQRLASLEHKLETITELLTEVSLPACTAYLLLAFQQTNRSRVSSAS